MKSKKEFPFNKARRVTPSEVEEGRKAIETLTGKARPKRKGRPPKLPSQKYIPISLRIHPDAMKWLRKEAKRKGVPYQSIINYLLLKESS